MAGPKDGAQEQRERGGALGSVGRWLLQQTERRVWERRAIRDKTGFLTDGFLRPSIGVAGGWILGGLFALVLWLTFKWAPEAATRAQEAPDALGDAITPEGGWAAIVIVATLALAAGWEQTIETWLDGARRPRWRRRAGRNGHHAQPPSLASTAVLSLPIGLLRLLWVLIKFIARIPSRILSVADWMLAKVFACAAGAHRRGYPLRYGVLALWVIGAFLAGLYLTPKTATQIGLPAAAALALLSFVMICIIGVARRWAWVEQDRDAFLITRTEEPRALATVGDDAPIPVRRVGFREDLRDEALTGLVCLFALIPLALMHIEMLSPGAFAITDAPDRPLSLLGYRYSETLTVNQVFGPVSADNPLSWYGYFGAELAKSVPFVDWSEVFHVPNGALISPATPTGASVVFGLRAGLDLLVLAAVLQAVSIAGRTRQVRAAFAGQLINLLDPFDERLYFARAERSRVVSPGAREIDQPGILNFTPFDRDRLLKRASGREEGARPSRRGRAAQKAMMAVAARQIAGGPAPDAGVPRPSDDPAPRLADAVEALAERVETARDPRLQRHALELFGEVGPLSETQRARLSAAALRAMTERKRQAHIRVLAAQELGRLGWREAIDPLAAIAFGENASMLGAAACVSLARLGDQRSEVLLEAFSDAGVAASMRAYAHDLLDGGSRLPLPVTVRLQAGAFLMGGRGPLSEEADDQPQHQRRISSFAMARTPLTFAQYDAFCAATGRKPVNDNGWGRGAQPVINVSWRDAQAYAGWLRLITGERWRLPSEAEWEYACRSGAQADYGYGDASALLGEYGWFTGNAGGRAHPVAELKPNSYGLYDMHGDVWEWCQDQWRQSHHGAPRDGSARISAQDTAVRRGGSWFDPASECRASDRLWARRGYRNVTIGARLAHAVIA